MSVTISYRMLATFVAGVIAAVIAAWVFQAVTADAAPGDTDATFVAMTPCRLMDTRANPAIHVGPHSTFGANDTKTVQARGTNGNCVIPADAVGLSLNVTAIGATAPTFLTIWPDGPRPDASSLNPVPDQPPTPNAVATNLSAGGSFEMFNLAGAVDAIVDVNGFYTATSLTDLDQRVSALETAGVSGDVLARLDALEAENVALTAKTAAMSIENAGSTVRFTGVDVQIVDGTGDTECSDFFGDHEDCNGTGNLIIGYNEDDALTGDELRSGSHNIVTGTDNDYQNHSGIVAGRENTTSDEYATVTAGFRNTASGFGSSVTGGLRNTASEVYSSVTGGEDNTADGLYSSVAGGLRNTASEEYSTVTGGEDNTASGKHSSVTGGNNNTASGDDSSVSGGSGNAAAGTETSVSGGTSNHAGGTGTSILGGDDGIASGDYAAIVGGSQNTADGPRAVAVGGGQNSASGSKAVVSGGSGREASGTFDWRAGAGSFEDS